MPNQNKNESPVLYVSLLRKGTADIDLDLRDQVTAFKYTDSDKKTDKCTFTVMNHDLSNFDKPLWKKGARLRVQWGFPGAVSQSRTVVIESVKGFTTLTVEAHGMDSLMNKTKRPRVFRKITRSGVANAIAYEYGFDEAHRHIQTTDKLYNQISQAGLTDAKLLTKLAKKEGFVFYVDFDGFHWHERDLLQAPKRRYVYGASVQIGEMVIGVPNIENDVTVPRYKGIRRKGINKETGEPFDEVASNTDTKRNGLAPELDNIEDIALAELDEASMEKEMNKLGLGYTESDSQLGSSSGGQDGGWVSDLLIKGGEKAAQGYSALKAEAAKAALNDTEGPQGTLFYNEDGSTTLVKGSFSPDEKLYSDPDETDSTDIDDSSNYHYVEVVDPRDKTSKLMLEGYGPIDESNTGASDAGDAKSEADNKYKRAQAVAVKLKFDVYGDAHLGAKTVVRFDAWGGGRLCKRISGLYYISEVEHEISLGSYICHIESRTDGGGGKSGAKTKSGSAANLNKDNMSVNPPYTLTPREAVDPDSKESTFEWRDSLGNSWSEPYTPPDPEADDGDDTNNFSPVDYK